MTVRSENIERPRAPVTLPELPPLTGSDALQLARNYLIEGRRQLDEAFAAGMASSDVVANRAALYDKLLVNLFFAADREFRYKQGAPDARLTLCAVGGYGRAQLSPHSDLDLLFLCPHEAGAYIETISERILYRLWDLSQEVGSSVRSIAQCIRLARKDLSAYTSLLDHRFLSGDTELYEEFDGRLFRAVFSKGVSVFLEMRELEDQSRRERYADTVYLLEPNIKQGEGGLRDLHQALWAARIRFRARNLDDLLRIGAISEREATSLRDAQELLLSVREHLHILSGRKQDRLTFEVQEQIAQAFGYRDTPAALAVEQFMQRYYAAAYTIRNAATRIIERCALEQRRRRPTRGTRIGEDFRLFEGSLTVQHDDLFRRKPEAIIELFHEAMKRQVPIYPYAKDLLAESLGGIDNRLRRHLPSASRFLEILTAKEDRRETLLQMHDLGVLGAYLPEFGRLTCKHQHTIYHVYTVDVHTLAAVERLRAVHRGDLDEEEPLIAEVMRRIERKRTLYLGVLLHDVGKGTGRDHSVAGAEMASSACKRLGLTPEEIQEVMLLVEKHLAMVHIATRRDMHDEELVTSFCRSLGDVEVLHKLMVMTYVDSITTGPNVWSQWKALLVQELYQRALACFRGEGGAPYHDSEAAATLRDEIRERLVGEPTDAAAAFLDSLPDRYVLATRPEAVARHYSVSRRLEQAPFAIHKVQYAQRGYTELLIACRDRPGLLALLAGAMAANRIDILSAQIFTRDSGETLDIFYVRDRMGRAVTDPNVWARLSGHLSALLAGETTVEELVESHHKPSPLERSVPSVKTKIEIDNESSATHTIVDVFTQDRVGVLYRITRTIYDLGLTIGLSKVTTEGNRVVDAFYVTSIEGEKILDAERLREIADRLHQELSAEDS